MHFPSKLDENIELLAKNNRFSDVEKGALLLHSMAAHNELTDDERRYGESVAAGWMRQRAEEQSDSPQWHQYYGKIRAAQMNGIPTALAESAIKSVDIQSGFRCRDCGYISKSSADDHDNDDAFEHTKTTLHTK